MVWNLFHFQKIKLLIFGMWQSLSCLVPLSGILMLAFTVEAHAENITHAAHSGEEGLSHVHGSHPECPLPATVQDILSCARENHPDVKRARLASSQTQALPSVAKQIPNPEFEAQSVYGKTLGDQQMQTQISVVQPIEWGGKRSARIRQAEARGRQADADVTQAQTEVTIQTVLRLYRLKQIEKEKSYLQEAINTFSKLIAQYRTRPRLTPEQEVGLATFEMARSDTKVKQSALGQEEREIEHYFHVATGHGLKEIQSFLPSAPARWPAISEHATKELPSPRLGRLVADHELSLADLDLAKSSAWPEFKVGPMIQLQNYGGIQSQLFGFQLNLSLPVFNLNGGGRAFAAKGIASAEGYIELLKDEDAHERAEKVRGYRSAVETLAEDAMPAADLQKRHHRVEALSTRGLVSSSLVIEAHRQMIELEKSRNERELKALVALWEIYSLEGRALKESL